MECPFELAAAAIVAGLTNVVTLRPDTLGAQYQKLGTGSLGLHQKRPINHEGLHA